jgi:Domain of unknown function (DUF4189)
VQGAGERMQPLALGSVDHAVAQFGGLRMISTSRRGSTAVAAVIALALASAPAFAGFGAVAYDQNDGKYGASWNEPTQAKAYELALKQCASPDCRVHPVEPKGCGALALSDKDKDGHIYWGGADRVTLAKAKEDAVAHCRKHTTGICTVRIFGCNK